MLYKCFTKWLDCGILYYRREVLTMAQVLVNFRLEEEDKKGMEDVCRDLGMSMSTALNNFAKKSVVRNGFLLRCLLIRFIRTQHGFSEKVDVRDRFRQSCSCRTRTDRGLSL